MGEITLAKSPRVGFRCQLPLRERRELNPFSRGAGKIGMRSGPTDTLLRGCEVVCKPLMLGRRSVSLQPRQEQGHRDMRQVPARLCSHRLIPSMLQETTALTKR